MLVVAGAACAATVVVRYLRERPACVVRAFDERTATYPNGAALVTVRALCVVCGSVIAPGVDCDFAVTERIEDTDGTAPSERRTRTREEARTRYGLTP